MFLFMLCLLVCAEAKRRMSDDDTYRNVDVYPQSNGNHAPFGNVYKDGFLPSGQSSDGHDDPSADLENLPERPRADNLRNKDQPIIFSNPRDEYLYNQEAKNTPENDTENDGPMWFDFPRLQERNIYLHNSKSYKKKKAKSQPNKNHKQEIEKKKILDMEGHKLEYFRKKSFEVVEGPNEDKFHINWTTCDEFGKGASFHPQDIVNVEWVPFYIWSEEHYLAVLHTYNFPTIKLVSEYRERYGQNLEHPVNWEEPKLLMKNMREMLLIAADRTGLFHGIFKYDFPDSLKGDYKAKIPILMVRLKIEDPYLVMMFCDDETPYAALMAVNGEEPPTLTQKRSEAASIGFKGVGAPVIRQIRLETEWKKAEQQQQADSNAKKRIYLHRDYGMFGPDELKSTEGPRRSRYYDFFPK